MATAPSTTPYFTAPYSFPARNPHPFPFPFFSPPPPPAPTPTPFTAPSAFGAPASGSPPIPPPPAYPYAYTAATAAPPYGVPPPPPQAYYYPPPTNPYLPFASAYTPASGFSPLPPPVPNPTPPTASQIHGDLHAPPQESTAPPPTGAPGSTSPSTQPWVASSPELDSPSPGLDSGRIFLSGQITAKDTPTTTIPTTASASKMQPDHAPTANTKHSSLLKLPDLESAEVQARAEATISKNMPRAVLDLNRRLDEQQARDRSSFDSLQGELAKLMSMAAQLAVSISKQTTSAIPCSSPLGVAATASGAPKGFDNMPTPRAGYENCFAHPNQRSYVHGVRTNLREQNLDYSLEQAAPETVFDVYDDKSDACSNEFIPMFTDTPEQVTVEKEKSESHQASECFSKPTFSPQRPTASTVGVFCLTNEQNTDNEPCGNHVKPQQIHNQQLNMLMTEAERKEWDPGTVKTIRFSTTPELLAKSFHKASENPSSEQLKCFSKETEYTTACLYIISDVGEFSLELQQQDDQRACNCPVLKASNSYVTRFSQFSIVPNVIELRLLWDPGDTKFHDLFINVAAATKLQCTDAYKSAMVKVLVVQFSARKASISGPTIMRSYTFGLTWPEVSVSVLFVLAVQCSTGRSVAKPFLFPSKDGNSRTNHSFPKLLMHSLCTTGVVQLPIQSHALEFCLIDMMSQNGSEFRNGQLIGMLQSPTINSSELLKHMVNVWWQWDPGIAVSSYMYIWPEMRAVKTLTGLQSPLFSDLRYQLQRSKTFYIWDLGILSLIDMMFGNTAVPNLFPTGLHIHRIPLPDCSALLPTTQTRTTVSSNVEVDELTSPCVVFHLQQSTKWNSPSSNGIKSSEYAYTMDLIIDRWKFLHEQGVEKTYKAKNLLSSPNYLQILEMDILFITFLPP